jgi:hypothetical protein
MPVPAKPLMEGFFRIMEIWGVDDVRARSLLGDPPDDLLRQWRNGTSASVTEDVLQRVGHVGAIWSSLEILYSDSANADGWVRRPNKHFGGVSPIEHMLRGVQEMSAVRQYLEEAKTTW